MTKHQKKQHERYERKVAIAERNEEAMLLQIKRKWTHLISLNEVVKLIGQYAHSTGRSFHEALFIVHQYASTKLVTWRGF